MVLAVVQDLMLTGPLFETLQVSILGSLATCTMVQPIGKHGFLILPLGPPHVYILLPRKRIKQPMEATLDQLVCPNKLLILKKCPGERHTMMGLICFDDSEVLPVLVGWHRNLDLVSVAVLIA